MLTILNSFTTHTLDSVLVKVEADVYTRSDTKTNIVGLPDTAIKEASERIKSAIRNSGFSYPRGKVTCNLSPASVRKTGSGFDLPLALAIIISQEESNKFQIENDMAFVGELSLDGNINPVKGIVSATITCLENGIKRFFVPAQNIKEALLVSSHTDLQIIGVRNLKEIILYLKDDEKIDTNYNVDFFNFRQDIPENLCMSYIKGQQQAKRALEISASGGHNVLMTGSPGSGKTMLARSIISILPDMTMEEILESTKIHSIAGTLNEKMPIINTRQFRSPHHTASAVSLIGGSNTIRPGEISLAHNGVLFLDELPEFPKAVLETLRQPMEDGFVVITRASGSVRYQTKFILVASQNPCPCGYFGDKERECVCNNNTISNYSKKVSGPLLDRIDIHLRVDRVSVDKLQNNNEQEKSEEIRKRVSKARNIQLKRGVINSQMNTKELNKYCVLEKDAKEILFQVVDKLKLSTRAYTRILRVSRTIADLEEKEIINKKHISEAISYRSR